MRSLSKLSALSFALRANKGVLSAFGQQRSAARISWEHVQLAPPDKILGVTDAFKKDTNSRKVNLGVGAYRTDAGKPWVLPSVKAAEQLWQETSEFDHEYIPIDGLRAFLDPAVQLAYGDEIAGKEPIAAVQSLSGTGALRIAAEWVKLYWQGPREVYVPDPTWSNHFGVYRSAGHVVDTYPYYNQETKGLHLKGMLDKVQSAKEGSVFVLHVCGHNPTGIDPSQDEWKQIEEAVSAKNHLVIFDMAYQGFASGDLEKDAYALRYFVKKGHKVFLAQSFAKNMGLYGERVGTFSVVCNSEEEKTRVTSQLKLIIRAMYSSPPAYFQRVASLVLTDPKLRSMWHAELREMAGRIANMRMKMYKILRDDHALDWPHIINQIGMFAYTGISAAQVERLAAEHNLYMTNDGRISLAGLNESNVKRVADAFASVSK